jgi:asparagine synthase (glutamine-hydrolysing)
MQRDLELFDCPIPNAGNMFWQIDLAETARRHGLGVLLTGQGGNLTVSWNGLVPPGFAQLVQQGRWKSAIWQHLLRPILPDGIAQGVQRWRKAPPSPEALSPIHPDFSRRLGLSPRLDALDGELLRLEGRRDAHALRRRMIGFSLLGGGAIHAAFGAGYRLESRDPTYDVRVMSYCQSVPDWVYTGPQGESRWLIRQAMAELLPAAVRENPGRGRQAADLGHRLLDSAGEVTQTLRRLTQSPLACRYLDLERMGNVWDSLQRTVDRETTQQAHAILARGLETGLFLVQQEACCYESREQRRTG